MKLLVLAVGHARGSAEGALAEDYLGRAKKLGRALGITDVAAEEIAVSKARETARRRTDEAARVAARLPEGAQLVLLDERGKAVRSADFASLIGGFRDSGVKRLVFVIGGPDGLAEISGAKGAPRLAFGPQTWPHLMVRAMLSEQIYRALTILAGHPYHRA